MTRHFKRPLVLALTLAMGAGIGLMAAPAALAATVNVGPGQSIQAAIDAASPGDTIVVAPGTYRENLFINKNNITLQGTPGATELAPPGAAKVTHNPCYVSPSNFDGICIKSADGVTVSGFTVRGFPGVGIHAIASDHLTLDNNRLNNNGHDGIAVYRSSFVTISHNQAAGSSDAGILVADSPDGAIVIDGNTTTKNGAGIYVRDLGNNDVFQGNFIINNDSEGNCVGILALDTPGGPAEAMSVYIGAAGLGGEQFGGNRVIANNKTCPPTQYLPATVSGTGILALGSQLVPGPTGASLGSNFTIRFNTVRDNVPSDTKVPYAGGIVLGTYPGSPALTDSNICCNVAFGNQPYDIRYIAGGNARRYHPNTFPGGIGTGIIIVLNNCDTSKPATAPVSFFGEVGPICRPEPAPMGF